MPFPFYPRNEPGPPGDLPVSQSTRHGSAAGYKPDKGLVDAVNVALLLGQPLLLTGEPGTGKTGLAYHLAWNLHLNGPLVFQAKTTSLARDLFYTFDTVGRFRAGNADPRCFVSYQALGQAILLAKEPESVSRWLPDDFKHPGPRRSIVLIDEVDKSPSDFPNDILEEMVRMSFSVPEVDPRTIQAPDDMRPVLVITSNSTKLLPDAFLRRCVYYDIPFPTGDRLLEIVASRLQVSPRDGPFLQEALTYFQKLRDPAMRLRKAPATAELLGWLDYLGRRIPSKEKGLRPHLEILRASLGILVKTADDHRVAMELLPGPVAEP